MIQSVDAGSALIQAVRRLSPCDPFACRITSLCGAYPPSLPFVGYWMITGERGGVVGAIARSGSSFVLLLTSKCDLAEITAFLRMAGAAQVLCDGRYSLDGFPREKSGVLMKATSRITESGDDCGVFEPDIRSVYALLAACEDEGFSVPAFEDFYVDVNHRLRHGAMRLYGIRCEASLAAAAMTVAESDGSAVIGAVACHPGFRRRGFGSAVVTYLTNRLIDEGKTVFLHRAAHKNAAFYERLCFESCGSWHEYEI